MFDLLPVIEKRKQILEKVIAQTRKKLKKAPKGYLRINGGKFYYRSESSDTNGTYIPQKNLAYVKELVQKDYDFRVLQSAESEYNALKHNRIFTGRKSEEVYESLSGIRQNLVETEYISDDLYARRWEEKEYEGPGFDNTSPEFITDKEEKVRSKSEVIIANMLHRYNHRQ